MSTILQSQPGVVDFDTKTEYENLFAAVREQQTPISQVTVQLDPQKLRAHQLSLHEGAHHNSSKKFESDGWRLYEKQLYEKAVDWFAAAIAKSRQEDDNHHNYDGSRSEITIDGLRRSRRSDSASGCSRRDSEISNLYHGLGKSELALGHDNQVLR
jgi:hypothetical protein